MRPDQLVDDLRNALPSPGCEAADLVVYLAKINGEWLHDETEAAELLSKGFVPTEVQTLLASSEPMKYAPRLFSRVTTIRRHPFAGQIPAFSLSEALPSTGLVPR